MPDNAPIALSSQTAPPSVTNTAKPGVTATVPAFNPPVFQAPTPMATRQAGVAPVSRTDWKKNPFIKTAQAPLQQPQPQEITAEAPARWVRPDNLHYEPLLLVPQSLLPEERQMQISSDTSIAGQQPALMDVAMINERPMAGMTPLLPEMQSQPIAAAPAPVVSVSPAPVSPAPISVIAQASPPAMPLQEPAKPKIIANSDTNVDMRIAQLPETAPVPQISETESSSVFVRRQNIIPAPTTGQVALSSQPQSVMPKILKPSATPEPVMLAETKISSVAPPTVMDKGMSESYKNRWFDVSEPIAPNWDYNPDANRNRNMGSPQPVPPVETKISMRAEIADMNASDPVDSAKMVEPSISDMPQKMAKAELKQLEPRQIIEEKPTLMPAPDDLAQEDMQQTEPAPKIEWVKKPQSEASEESSQNLTETAQASVVETMSKPKTSFWRVKKGEKVQDILSAWAEKEGIDFEWKSFDSYSIAGNMMIKGTLDGAVQTLLTRGFGANPPLEAIIQVDQENKSKTLVIKDS